MKVFGITAYAKTGKDSFADLSCAFLQKQGKVCRKFSLADEVKSDLWDFVYTNYNINLFKVSGEQKEVVRPLMIAHGMAKRKLSNGKHWIDLCEKKVKSSFADVVFIPDIRFAEYDEDELSWIKGMGKLISLSREGVGPVSDEERINGPKLIESADFKVNWPNMTEKEQVEQVEKFWNEIQSN